MKIKMSRWHMPPVRRIWFVVGICSLICLCILLWWRSTHAPYISKNFMYSADVVAASDTYDQADHHYTGEEYSSGKFYAQMESQTTKTSTLNFVLDIQPREGNQSVAKINKQQNLDTKSGAISGHNVYPFAPANLHRGEDFTGSYLLYDQPAHMHYVDVETIYGLRVYRYRAEYSPSTQLVGDGIPIHGLTTSQKISFSPTIQLWVEPTTGWLIKIEDNTTINIINSQTGKTIAPYSRFSASYSEASIKQQIAYASDRKQQQSDITRIAPSCGLLLCLVFPAMCYVRFLRRHRAELALYVAGEMLVLSMVAALIGWIFHYRALTNLFLGTVAINPLAIVGFALCLITLASLRKNFVARWVSILSALGVVAIGIVTAAGTIHISKFQPDISLSHLFFKNLNVATWPSQFSLHDANMFVLLGVGLSMFGGWVLVSRWLGVRRVEE